MCGAWWRIATAAVQSCAPTHKVHTSHQPSAGVAAGPPATLISSTPPVTVPSAARLHGPQAPANIYSVFTGNGHLYSRKQRLKGPTRPDGLEHLLCMPENNKTLDNTVKMLRLRAVYSQMASEVVALGSGGAVQVNCRRTATFCQAARQRRTAGQ